jgi:hypothetical protein
MILSATLTLRKTDLMEEQPMRATARFLLVTIVFALPVTGPAGLARATGDQIAGCFRAGANAVDVTPRKFPVSMLGSFSDRRAESAHDPLYVRALVLDDGKTRLALAVCDNCIITRDVVDRAKQLAAAATGIPCERMLVAATHTHTAPNVTQLNDIPADPEYIQLLVAGIAEAVRLAAERLEPAQVGWGVVAVPEEVFNRRWHLRQETLGPNPLGGTDRVRTNPGAGNPDLVRPAGPTDPDVSVLSIRTAAGKPLALLANYSLHYVGGVPGSAVSADYFGEFCREMETRMAGGQSDSRFVAILTNGASGDVNNINFREPRPSQPPFERIRQVARRVADAAEAACRKITYRDNATLAMARRDILLGVRKPEAEELERAKSIIANPKDSSLPPLAEYYARSAIALSQYPDKVPLELQAIRIGSLGIAAIPCEVFAEIGLEIKRRSPLETTFTIELANGYNGYLPTPEQHALGGYETWRATSSYLEVDASTAIVRSVVELLGKVSQ